MNAFYVICGSVDSTREHFFSAREQVFKTDITSQHLKRRMLALLNSCPPFREFGSGVGQNGRMASFAIPLDME